VPISDLVFDPPRGYQQRLDHCLRERVIMRFSPSRKRDGTKRLSGRGGYDFSYRARGPRAQVGRMPCGLRLRSRQGTRLVRCVELRRSSRPRRLAQGSEPESVEQGLSVAPPELALPHDVEVQPVRPDA